MDIKISPQFWSDPDIEALTANERFAALWLLTNSTVSLFGFSSGTPRRFAFETGLPEEALRRAIEALPKTFVAVENGVWIRNFISYQLGKGPALAKNNITKALLTQLQALGKPLLTALVCEHYPELSPLLSSSENLKPLPTPPGGVRVREGERVGVGAGAGEPKSAAESESGSDLSALGLQSARIAISEILRVDPARTWSHPAEHALTTICPIPLEEIEAVRWLHRQPATETRPKVRTNPTSLCEYWTDEVAKARGFAKAAGIDLSRLGKNFAKKEQGGAGGTGGNGPAAPYGWTRWVISTYPNAIVTEFSELPADIQAEALAALTPPASPEA